jgi:hypothetical protein
MTASLDLALLDSALADREAQGNTEQLGVSELLPRARVAIVVHDFEARLAQLAVEAVGDLARRLALLAERHELDVPRRDRARPRDSLLVGELLHGSGRDPGWADPVRPHPDQLLVALLVEIGGAERLRVASPELEDVADLDRGLDPDLLPRRIGVAGLDRTDVRPLRVEVTAGLHARDVLVRFIGARDQPLETLQGLVRDNRHARPERADEARDRPEVPLHLVLLRGAEVLAESVPQLYVVQTMVPAREDEQRPPFLADHREGLDQRTGGQAEELRHGFDRGRARRLDRIRGTPGQTIDGLGRGARHLDVGRVTRRRQCDLVLAGRTRRHVLVCAEPSHHADVGLDPVPLEPAAVEDAVIGLDVQVVPMLEPVRIAVERVRVLHDELARPQHAGARPRLVTLLDLDVVEDQRQVAV